MTTSGVDLPLAEHGSMSAIGRYVYLQTMWSSCADSRPGRRWRQASLHIVASHRGILALRFTSREREVIGSAHVRTCSCPSGPHRALRWSVWAGRPHRDFLQCQPPSRKP